MPNGFSTIALDEENFDIHTDTSGQLAIITSRMEVVAQAIRCRMKVVLGEWYQDPSIGVALFDGITVKNPNLPYIRSVYAAAIADVPGVKTVDSISIEIVDRAARKLKVNFTCTADDDSVISGSV